VPKKSKSLTVKFLQNLKPGADKRETADGGCPGLYHILYPSGAAAWALRYRDASGRQHKLQLGAANLTAGEHDPVEAGLSLAAARAAASKQREQVSHGANPAAERAAQNANTFAALVPMFLEQHGKKIRANTLVQYKLALTNEVLTRWANRSVHAVKPADISSLTHEVAAKFPVWGNRVHAALSVFYRWLSRTKHIVASNPVALCEKPAKETPRDRFLDDAEIVKVWQAAEQCSPAVRALVKLLLLTGARRSEVAGIKKSELGPNMAYWTLPSPRAKNHHPLIVPLSKQVQAVIKTLPPTEGNHLLVEGRAFSGFGEAKTMVDDCTAKPALAHWTFNDLRRTASTGLASIGVPPHIIDKLTNHQSGKISGVAATYNRFEYGEEKKAAMDAWGAHVVALVTPPPSGKLKPSHLRVVKAA
jgi:integrase